MPAHNDYRPYLQVDLRSLYRVTGLQVQGSSSYVYAYAVIVLYSEDGWTWKVYTDDQSDNARQFEANHSPGNDINHINFAKPFTVELLCLLPHPFFFLFIFFSHVTLTVLYANKW